MRLPIFFYVTACLVFSFYFAQPFRTPKVAVLMLCLAMLGCQRPKMAPKSWVILAWALWPIVMPIQPFDPVTALYERGIFFMYVLAACLVWPLGGVARGAIAEGLGWAGLLVGLYGVAQAAGLDWIAWETPGQANSFFGNANFSAHFLLLAWHLGAYQHKPVAMVSCACMGLAIVLSGSRAVLILWVLTLIMTGVLKFGWKHWPFGLAAVAIVGMGLLFRNDLTAFYHNVTHPERYVSELERQPDLIADRDTWFKGKRLSLMSRVALYSNSAFLLAERPLTGIGAGQFRSVYPTVALKGIPDFHLSDAYRAASPHQLILESAILFGIPWTCVGMVLLGVLVWRVREDRPYVLALISQVLLAMVSLNAQNPIIVVTLILLLPSIRKVNKTSASRWFVLVWLVPALLVVGLDGWRGFASRQKDWEKVPMFFPEFRAQRAFESGDLPAAWRAQKRALKRDPFGPETIFNTGLVAWQIGEGGDARGYDLAVHAFQLVQCLSPNYRPASDRLIEIENSGYWEAEWPERIPCDGAVEERNRWLLAIESWQPQRVP